MLYSAVVRAVTVNVAKTWLTGALPEVWLFALGALFVAVTIALPKGIAGSLSSLLRRQTT
jgi:urea transport system permease protein